MLPFDDKNISTIHSRSIKGVDDHVHITALSNARITLHNDDGLQ